MGIKSLFSKKCEIDDLVGNQIGHGYYSTVYLHKADKDKVIKIFNKDKGYEKFLRLVLKHPECKSFPHIYSTFRTKGGTKCVVLERLEENIFMSRRIVHEIDPSESNEIRWVGLPPKCVNEDFMEAIRIMNSSFLFRGNTMDVHSGNIMFRGKDPVVTDPAC